MKASTAKFAVASRGVSLASESRSALCISINGHAERVRIMTKKACEKAEQGERVDRFMLEWERDDLLSILTRMKIRASDEELQKADPKGRPLAV